MEAMRESWTDDRLDDLNRKTDALRLETKAEFARERNETKAEFATARSEMNERFDKVDERFDKVDRRFDKIDERFDKVDRRFERFEVRGEERFEAMMDHLYAMQRLMIQFCTGALVTLLAFLVTRL
jgi:uncharacterized coiled-coil DUF342 family protein